MDEFMVRDPRDCADQEAYHVDRKMRGQGHNCADHPRTIDICPDVLQVDVENEQRNSEGDDTIAERFSSTLGHRRPVDWAPDWSIPIPKSGSLSGLVENSTA